MRIDYLGKKIRLCSPFPLHDTPLSWIEGSGDVHEVVHIKGYHSYRPIPHRKTIYVPSDASPFRIYGFVMYGLRYFYSFEFDEGILLHASGVETGDGAVLFVSRPGGGKSYALKMALSMGFRYLGEDMVILKGGRVFVHPPFTVMVDTFAPSASLKRVCFIEYSPGAFPLVLRIPRDRGIPLAMNQTFNLERVFDTFDKHIPESVEFFISRYSDFQEVMERCLSWHPAHPEE